jgi:hypothetical protein
MLPNRQLVITVLPVSAMSRYERSTEEVVRSRNVLGGTVATDPQQTGSFNIFRFIQPCCIKYGTESGRNRSSPFKGRRRNEM